MDRVIKWNHPDLEAIISMRFKQSPSAKLIDVDGCEGKMKDGTLCTVDLPFRQLPKTDYYGAMIDYARVDGVHVKGLGVFNGAVITITWRRAS